MIKWYAFKSYLCFLHEIMAKLVWKPRVASVLIYLIRIKKRRNCQLCITKLIFWQQTYVYPNFSTYIISIIKRQWAARSAIPEMFTPKNIIFLKISVYIYQYVFIYPKYLTLTTSKLSDEWSNEGRRTSNTITL